uniref:hypothetical protein n=1 Tax=Holdemanella biformis TaxID=1735 RepID=UPI00265E72B7|nr:hypothetical protein [Holdemanella biformis]
MNILMNSMYYVCEQCFYLKITKNSLYPKCILSFLLNGLCVFLTSEYIHINWLSVFLQLLIPVLCLNISTKEHHILESIIANLIVVLFQTMNILLFRSLTIEYYAFSTILTIGGCAIFYQIFKYESLEFSENMQYSVSIILFIFSYLYMLLMTDLFSKTEFTYMYFIKNSQIYVFMFTISVLVLLSVAIIVFSRIRSKLEIEMYRNFIELSSHYTEQMIHEQTGIKELIHDMRNSLDDIKHLSQNKRYEELESEINRELVKYGKLYPNSICINPYVDVILQNFIQEHNLNYDIQIHVPKRIDSMDPQAIQMDRAENMSLLILSNGYI